MMGCRCGSRRMMMAWRSFLENLLGSYKVRHPRWPQNQPNFRPIPRPSLGEIGAGIGEGARVTSPRREIRRMPFQALACFLANGRDGVRLLIWH